MCMSMGIYIFPKCSKSKWDVTISVFAVAVKNTKRVASTTQPHRNTFKVRLSRRKK